MERYRRLVLCLFSLLLIIPYWIKGHGPTPKGDGLVAFSHEEVLPVRIKVSGCNRDGIYYFHEPVHISSVMELAVGTGWSGNAEMNSSDALLGDGKVLVVSVKAAQKPTGRVETMSVRDKLLLGIPLDLNQLNAEEWEQLPGIGPSLARRIVEYRQKCDGFSSLDDLLQVNGVGSAKIRTIARYLR